MQESIDYLVGSRLRQYRRLRGYSLIEFSAMLHRSKSAISKYERGERELPLRLAVRLAEFYGVSVDYLVGVTDEQRPYPRKKK